MKRWLVLAAVSGGMFSGALGCGDGDGGGDEPRSQCPAQDPEVDWIHGDNGSSLPGTDRQIDEGFTLCSDASGLAETIDNYHYVGQVAPGDFSMMAVVTRLDDGEASLVFAPQVNDILGARLRITLKKAAQGFDLEAASRASGGVAEASLASAHAAQLPVTLSLTRGDATLHVFSDETGALTELVAVEAATGELASGGFVVLAQASGVQGKFSEATFERVTYEASVEEAEPDCSDALLATPAAPLTIYGRNMSRVRSVVIGDATVVPLTTTNDYVVVETPQLTGSVVSVAVRTPTQTRYMPAPLGVARVAQPAPAISDMVDAAGDRAIEVHESDDVFLEGVNFPAPGVARVWLGRNEVTVEADSTAQRLHLKVNAIAANEAGCPRIFVPSGPAVRDARYGDVYSVRESFAPHLCPALKSPTPAEPPRLVTTQAGVSLAVPRNIVGGERFSVLWAASATGGASRGARVFEVEVPRVQLGTGGDRYAETLSALAKVLGERMNGTKTTTPCACDVLVMPDAEAGTLVLQPCLPVPVDPDEPEPSVPGLPTELESNKLIWSLLDVLPQELPPEPPNCNGVTPDSDPRHFSWCEFMRVTLNIQGFPRFESFDPLNRIVAQNHAPSVGEDDPLLRPLSEKYILLEPGLASRYVSLGYASPCGYAARAHYCGSGFVSSWMPRFRTGDRLLKLFWVREADLGSAMNKDLLYSYQPPNSQRFYLVGMHIAVARFDMFSLPEGYFRWITLWVPSTGESSPRYNEHCGVQLGHKVDQPDALQGTPWGQFVMCTEVDDVTTCGNPWGPADECTVNGAVGCKNCHEDIGHVQGSVIRVEAAWLGTPRYMNNAIEACYQTIKSGEEDYSDTLECEWSDLGLPSDPFL